MRQAQRLIRVYPYGVMVVGLVVLSVKGHWVDAAVVLAALVALVLSMRAVQRDRTIHEPEASGGLALTGEGTPARRPTPAVVWAYMAIVWLGFAVIWLTSTERPIGRVLAAGCGAVAVVFLVISVKRQKGQRRLSR